MSCTSDLSQSLRYPSKLSSAMALNALYSSKLCFPQPNRKIRPSESSHLPLRFRSHPTNTGQTRPRESLCHRIVRNPKTLEALLGLGVGLTLTLTGPASAVELPILGPLQLNEPSNALSLPTWAIHVSSVVEWITAMALVWQYGEKAGYESWKGLSWGMVPLLGGAFCACTWHFFYNSESLEVLVALQAALTVVGNATMCIAAFRIYKSTEERSKNV